MEAVEQVCSGEDVPAERVLDPVVSLVDKSLVTIVETEEGTTRYRLLETLRAYGQEMLAARGETEEMARRHAWFCVDLAEAVEPVLNAWERDMISALHRLDAEAENLAAAMRWSLASGQPAVALRIGGAAMWWIMMRAHFAQYAEWVKRALARDCRAAPSCRTKALFTVALYLDNVRLGGPSGSA